MKSTPRLKRMAVAIGGAVAIAGLAGTARGSSGPPPPRAGDVPADIASGKAHRLPDSPTDTEFSSVWRNCQFVLIQTHSTHYKDGDVEVAIMDSSPEEVAAQLPPEEPACAGVKPTAHQIAADQARLYDLSESVRPKSPHPGPEGGNPGPPPTLPPHG